MKKVAARFVFSHGYAVWGEIELDEGVVHCAPGTGGIGPFSIWIEGLDEVSKHLYNAPSTDEPEEGLERGTNVE